jgi:zinc protease
MSSRLSTLRCTTAAFVLAIGLCIAPAGAEISGGPPAEPARASWPHESARLAPDPAVRFGTLDNGMRYAIMRNTQPSGIASVRLRFAAGSIYETEETEGIAHFLEHMAFNGSQNVPEGEMVKLLQRAGLAFGADTNAYTSFRETVYTLDLPKTDDETVDTALFLMREAADNLLFDAKAIDRERGVVLSEERTRNSPEYRLTRARLNFLLRGQAVPERFPIGDTEDIRSVDAADFRAFYEGHYRPERALLVIVGDFEPAAMDAKIRARFSDWRAEGPATDVAPLGRVMRRKPEAAHFVEPGLSSSVTLTFVAPPDLTPDSERARRESIVRSLGFAVLNRRLQRIAREENAPFISAGASRSTLERSATLAGVSASVKPGRWREALQAIEQETRRVLRHGVLESELAREITEYRTSYVGAVAAAATRDTRNLADGLAGAYHSADAFTHPETDLALFERAVADLSPKSVNAALRKALAGGGPLLFVSGAEPIEGGNEAVLAAWRESAKVAVAPPEAQAEAVFAYEFGAPGAVAERTFNEEFGVHLVRFANGALLTIKQTPFEDDTIRVAARFPGGLATWPKDKPGLAILAPFVMSEGALGRMSSEEIERAFADKIAGVSFRVGENNLSLFGSTRPEDLTAQLKLLAASTVDPGWRPQGLQRIQSAAENFIRQYSTTPGRVLGRDAGAIVRSGDPRWDFPTLDAVQALTMDDFRAAIGPALATAAPEISIVGDVTPEAAIEAVAATFGALPERARAPLSPAPIRFPAPPSEPIRLEHQGRPDQAAAFIAWPAVDFSDSRKARATRLARLVLENRLVEEYREAQGATYSPGTGEDLSDVFPGFGYVSASVEIPIDQADEFFKTVAAIVDEIKAGGFDDDVLARARGPALESARTSERGNNYWAAVLADAQTNPDRFHLMRTRITELEAITKAEIVAAARATFVDAKALRILVEPATTP